MNHDIWNKIVALETAVLELTNAIDTADIDKQESYDLRQKIWDQAQVLISTTLEMA
jgi:hypothetical protein